jgi:hypothetical protein
MRATCAVHFFLLDFIILILFAEEYKLWRSLLWHFLQPPNIPSLLGPIFSSAPSSEISSIYVFSLMSEAKIYKTTGKIIYLAHFPKAYLCDLLPLCVSVYPLINCSLPHPIFMKLGMYIMTPEPISTDCFINPSNQSVCICMLIGSGSVKILPRQRIHKQEYKNC